jgi:hypothetical protein
MALVLSGMSVAAIPRKNIHARSRPSHTTAVVCRNVGHTN